MLVQGFGRVTFAAALVLAAGAAGAAGLRHGDAAPNEVVQNGNPCDVIGIRISDREPSMAKIKYKLDLRDPGRCKDGSWNIRVLTAGEGRSFSSNKVEKRLGTLCMPTRGNFSLKVGSVTSDVVTVPSPFVTYSHAFQAFSTKSLELNINSWGDDRAEKWSLTVLECDAPGATPKGPVEARYAEECAKVPDVGCESCSTHIRLGANFDVNTCYVFHLDPVGKDKACPLHKDNTYFTHPSGCRPSDLTPTQPPDGRPTPLWVAFVAVGALAAGVTCALLSVALRGKLRRRPKNEGVANSGSATETKRHPLPLMVLYARDGVEHLARVSAFVQDLRSLVDCQILDLHDEGNSQILADPAGHILEAMSLRSHTRVILILSPGVRRLQRSFLDNGSDKEAPSNPPGECGDLKDHLFLLALKRLHEADLVYNYSRIFVVSLDDTDTSCKSDQDVKLLVESCRYQLPKHWPLLSRMLLLAGQEVERREEKRGGREEREKREEGEERRKGGEREEGGRGGEEGKGLFYC